MLQYLIYFDLQSICRPVHDYFDHVPLQGVLEAVLNYSSYTVLPTTHVMTLTSNLLAMPI